MVGALPETHCRCRRQSLSAFTLDLAAKATMGNEVAEELGHGAPGFDWRGPGHRLRQRRLLTPPTNKTNSPKESVCLLDLGAARTDNDIIYGFRVRCRAYLCEEQANLPNHAVAFMERHAECERRTSLQPPFGAGPTFNGDDQHGPTTSSAPASPASGNDRAGLASPRVGDGQPTQAPVASMNATVTPNRGTSLLGYTP